MKVAVYARISTNEERQNLETQLLPLRNYCIENNLEVYREFTDTASARDLLRRVAWRQLIDDAIKHKFQTVLVFKYDRAFRSVKDMWDILTQWETLGIAFHSIREDFDTRTALGRLMINILASMAEFELELIRERIYAGLIRAKASGTRSGKAIGRPQRDIPPTINYVLARYANGLMSLGEASREAGIPKTTMKRLIDRNHLAQGNGR